MKESFCQNHSVYWIQPNTNHSVLTSLNGFVDSVICLFFVLNDLEAKRDKKNYVCGTLADKWRVLMINSEAKVKRKFDSLVFVANTHKHTHCDRRSNMQWCVNERPIRFTLVFSLKAIKRFNSRSGLNNRSAASVMKKTTGPPSHASLQSVLSAKGQYHFSAEQIVNLPLWHTGELLRWLCISRPYWSKYKNGMRLQTVSE